MASQTNGLNGHNSQNVQKLLQNLEGINAESFGNDGERIQAVAAAYARLETPWEFIARLCMGQVQAYSQLSWTEVEKLSASARSCSDSGKRSAAFREVA